MMLFVSSDGEKCPIGGGAKPGLLGSAGAIRTGAEEQEVSKQQFKHLSILNKK